MRNTPVRNFELDNSPVFAPLAIAAIDSNAKLNTILSRQIRGVN